MHMSCICICMCVGICASMIRVRKAAQVGSGRAVHLRGAPAASQRGSIGPRHSNAERHSLNMFWSSCPMYICTCTYTYVCIYAYVYIWSGVWRFQPPHPWYGLRGGGQEHTGGCGCEGCSAPACTLTRTQSQSRGSSCSCCSFTYTSLSPNERK